MKRSIITLLLASALTTWSNAQTLFVDHSNGHDNAKGTIDAPLASLRKAVALTRTSKFVGNANPAVVYYYAIERHSPDLKGLRISQCIFTGSRNAAPIQGAVFAQGPDITVDHCIFYECKNALLLFVSITGFSLTNSIIYGSYEGAIWFGKYSDFVFRDNIIANNNCFWVNMPGYAPHYTFDSSLVAGNTIFMGLNSHGKVGPDENNLPTTNIVQGSGKVTLNLVDTDTIPRLYLHPSPASAGQNIPAGLFRSPRPPGGRNDQ
jgi:hypothetical protein